MENVSTLPRERDRMRVRPARDRLGDEIRAVEREHHELFARVLKFSNSVAAGSTAVARIHALRQVLSCAQKHFLHEEALMSKLPRLSRARLLAHQAEHCDIIEQLSDYIEVLMKGEAGDARELKHVLDSLVVHHIRHDAESTREWMMHV
jgi:hemerythrin-like metal-binding protein